MIKKVIISIMLIMAMCFNSVSVLATCDDIKGGSILHAWCWSFKTIEKNMQEIADAGYDAVQVSPPQECLIKKDCAKCSKKIVKKVTKKIIKKNGKVIKEENGEPTYAHKKGCSCFKDNWYFQYQPTNFKIGNYQLGTRTDFKKMCDAAKRHNVKVIVDIVANHVTNKLDAVSKEVYDPNKDEFLDVFHGINNNKNGNDGRIHINKDWGNRFKVTQGSLYGLYDLNTGKSRVQEMIKNYMNDCLDCGVWGFRYDAAKHIELPKEIDGDYGSDFWPNITKNAADKGAKWQYGEVLQDPNGIDVAKFKEYSKYMDVTASKYGKKIRDAIRGRYLNHNYIMNYESDGVEDNKLVTWLESHDNYANGQDCSEASAWLNDNEIRVGWAIVAGRAAGMPLFFSRPVGGGGRNIIDKYKSQFPEITKIGDKGSDLFKDPYIVAINKFRKAMKDEDEYLRSKDNNLLIIERGNKGMVIINWSGNSEVSSETRLSNGTYVDVISKREFKVENGRMFGNTQNEITILTKKQ